jgi:hypothetical protein
VSAKFPNLFIIGAMKAGTTSLHECLARHPEIFMSQFKEPQYFSPHEKKYYGVWGEGGELPEPGMSWYLRLFANAGNVKYAGESSTSYTKAPWVTGCAARIHAFNPDARLIYLVRDPADRTMSHYWYQVSNSWETRTPLEAVQSDRRYTAFSDYEAQLRSYADVFGLGAIHVLTLESLIDRPADTLNCLCRWLGITPLGPGLTFDSSNVGPAEMRQIRPLFVRVAQAQRHWRWRAFRSRHAWLQQLLRRTLYRPVRRDPAAEEAARAYLRPLQSEQVARFSALLKREFPEWKSVV